MDIDFPGVLTGGGDSRRAGTPTIERPIKYEDRTLPENSGRETPLPHSNPAPKAARSIHRSIVNKQFRFPQL